jgi:hypothetical protein
MDGTGFDAILRSLTTSGTRRGVVRRGAIGALAVALAGLGIREPAAAAPCRGRDAGCRRNDQCCSGQCHANRTCAAAGVGKPCNPNTPSDCRSGQCGCTKRDIAGTLIDCTCRRATCADDGEEGCAGTADCCDGRCLASRGVCLPPAQQCIREGQSCSSAPTLCCPGFSCTGGVCAD